jgi:hypothetical protein
MKDSTFITVCLLTKQYEYQYLKKLSIYLEQKFSDYEILLIDSNKQLDTILLDTILNEIPCVRFLEYSGSFNNNLFQMVAMGNSIGDYLVFFDLNVDPCEVIENIVKIAKKSDVVIGIAEYHNSIGYRIGRIFISKFCKNVGKISSNTTNLICVSRNAINTILKIGSSSCSLITNICNSGLYISYYKYEFLSNTRYFKSYKYALLRLFNLLIFSSLKPLRACSVLGFIISFISFVVAFCAFVMKLFNSNLAVGWTSTIIILAFFFMMLFVILGVMLEYMNRILSELENRQAYSICSEKTSKIMINEDRLNVLSESTKDD